MNLSIVNAQQNLQTSYSASFRASIRKPNKLISVKQAHVNTERKNNLSHFFRAFIMAVGGLFGYNFIKKEKENPERQEKFSNIQVDAEERTNSEQNTNSEKSENKAENNKAETTAPTTQDKKQFKQDVPIINVSKQEVNIQKKPRTREERMNDVIEQTKDLAPYDEQGKVNGQDWKRAINIIHKNICWSSRIGVEDWEKAFEQIVGKGQIVQQFTFRDGGSKEWCLKNGTKVFNNHRTGFLTVEHPDGIKEIFNPDGTPKENKD